MRNIKIITDSTADLSKELLDKYDISVIPLYVNIGGQSYKDMVDITPLELYKLVDKYNELPKSSAPPIANFLEVFRKYVNEGYDIIHISISSNLSSSYQNALLASKEFEDGRVYVVDSKNLSTGIGQLVILAADLKEKGLDAKAIYEELIKTVPKVRSSFIISTLKYLYMGGRCSSLQMIAGSLLKIHPQIIVENGGMIVGSKYRGKEEKILRDFYNDHVGDGAKLRKKRVFVTHSVYDNGAKYLKELLEQNLDIDEVLVTHASCVISTHCGPGTVGILYIED